ncbi:Yip1 domain-containing protein [Salinihabitans flavidus]|uniref:Yip1 domain-containing protein n=1 Tax=Salinihabitans flavidus TaxID=569882 RepID=A0A1H8PXJ3_9RHOB|nr:Yip1 family protein [Salinihabitans flavidus]SEO46404.1 Yip1 domain-containing protein [Salinihabitans flavidus]
MIDTLRPLFIETIRAPARAGAMLMETNLPRATLWSALVLACILNTLIFFVSTALFPAPSAGMLLPLSSSPVMVLTLLLATTVLTIIMLFWGGRALGGAARFEDVLGMITWLQFMRLAVQVAALVFMFLLPGLAALLVMGAGIYGIWILLNFMNVAHGFDSLGRSAMLLVVALIGISIGLTLLLSLIGVTAMGMD